MKRVKITVLKRTTTDDLFKEYAGPVLPKLCQYHEEGQVYYSDDGWRKPDGLCDNAWKSMMEYVMTFVHGGKNIFGGWINKEHVAIASCNDGLRPVIFKVEVED